MIKKEKLTEKPFLLILNGPSCAGKSTVSDLLFEKFGGIYKGKSDAIKWLISDYDPNVHRGLVHYMTLETMRLALAHGLSVVKEGALWEPEAYVELAKEARVPFVVANISAPWEVLTARFELRAETKKQGARVSNTSPQRFRELYDMYHDTRMETPLEFDSSKQSPEEIVETIIASLRSV